MYPTDRNHSPGRCWRNTAIVVAALLGNRVAVAQHQNLDVTFGSEHVVFEMRGQTQRLLPGSGLSHRTGFAYQDGPRNNTLGYFGMAKAFSLAQTREMVVAVGVDALLGDIQGFDVAGLSPSFAGRFLPRAHPRVAADFIVAYAPPILVINDAARYYGTGAALRYRLSPSFNIGFGYRDYTMKIKNGRKIGAFNGWFAEFNWPL